MRISFSLIGVWLLVSPLAAQYTVRMEIVALPGKHPVDSDVYLAGSFNNWNPGNEKYKFQLNEKGNLFLVLKLAMGIYEYKITRGGWDKVECKKDGTGITNRNLKVETDDTVEIDIEEWQDRFATKPRLSTAGKNVRIIDTAYYIPQLNRTRRVWICLPPGYHNSKKNYPVLYMHDGQNIFEDTTAFSGEWGVDEFFDTSRLAQAIVVAVDHGGNKRINEYCPYDMNRFGNGEGNHYAEFLAKTLKPFIDKNYRTRKCRKHTFVAGSSMGGLISLYTTLKYPKVFGGAGVFSPAFWVGPGIFDDIKAKGKKVKARIYFYAGQQEGESMVPLTLKAMEEMSNVSRSKMRTVIRQDGKHNEATWKKEFPLFYQWLMQ